MNNPENKTAELSNDINYFIYNATTDNVDLFFKEVEHFNKLYSKAFMDFSITLNDYSFDLNNYLINESMATISFELSKIFSEYGKVINRHGKQS